MRGFKITIFGMITVSLDVKIVNIFVFTEIRVHLSNANVYRYCVFFFRAIRSPPHKSKSARALLRTSTLFASIILVSEEHGIAH